MRETVKDENAKTGVPLWAQILIGLTVGFLVSQCTSANFKLIDISSDQFALRLKLDRIERKIDALEFNS